jgi:hypothetical protein
MNVDFRRKVAVSLACLLLIFCTTYALGQGTVTGSISGTVVDPQGAVIVGAKITAKSAATNQDYTDVTGANGAFALRQLPPGSYTLTITAPNFQALSVKDVVVHVGVDTALGAEKLTIGAQTDTVTVEATVPLVETSTAQISTTFENKQITDLPIGSAFDSLVLLIPGAASTGDAGFSNTNGAGISMNGQRGRSNNFQIDGQSNNDNSVAGPSIFLGNQDVLAEYQVINNSFTAEYGRNMGSVINYITKSGSNSLHGTAFWFYTGSWLSSMTNQDKSPLLGACIPPATAASTMGACFDPKPARFDENRVGGTVGGPIKKNKAWFFASFMRDYQRFGATPSNSGSATTPTPAGIATLAGCFPGSPAVVALQTIGPYGVTAGSPAPFGATSTVAVGACPGVQFAGVSRFLTSSFNDNEITGRIDVQVTQKDRFFGRYIYQDNNLTNATGRFAAGAVVGIPARDQQIGLDWVHTFTDHFINQARFGFSRAGFGFQGGTFPTCTDANILACPSGIQFQTNFVAFGMQNNLPQGRLINVSQWQDNASWVHGRHTIKFGGEYDRQRSPNVFLPNINGTFTFADFASFVANTPIANGLNLTDGPDSFNFKEQDAAVYVQDGWRWKDNLTLNFGLRWEYYGQAINLLHDLTLARETGPLPFWSTALPIGQRTVPQIDNVMHNFGPNFGFAYTPHIWPGLFGRDKTVIRGGFRIAYDPEFYNMFLNMATAAPVVNAGSVTAGLPGGGATPTGLSLRAAGYLALIPTGGNPGARNETQVPTNFHNPYAEQWNFGFQRELNSKIALEINYVGNHTIGNFQTVNANPNIGPPAGPGLFFSFPALVPAGVTPCATNAPPATPGFNTHPNCNFTNVRLRDNGAWSKYNGLQSELRLQSWHGLSGSFAYTWSHAIDNVSEIFNTNAAGNGVAGSMDPFNPNQPEHGTGGTSYTHVISVWWVYELPWYKSQAGFMGKVLGGWQLNGIYRYRSGEPFNPLQTTTSSRYCDSSFNNAFFGGVDTCRPILNDVTAPLDSVGFFTLPPGPGGCVLADLTGAGAPFHWIRNNNNAALCLGNPFLGAGRNILRAQSFNNLDFGVYKNFKMGERVTMQFQANSFNLLNRQYRGTPDPFIVDGALTPGCLTAVSNTCGSFMSNAFNNSGNRSFTFGMRWIF